MTKINFKNFPDTSTPLSAENLNQMQDNIDNSKVEKVEGKGLSTNDFTKALKDKLDGISVGANKTTIVNNLTSTSTTSALSANQGKILNEKIGARINVLWTGNQIVKTTIGNKLTLSNMPNLKDYVGKTISFYFSYGSDVLVRYSICLTDGTNGFFYTYTRNNSGNDLWIIEISINNIKSTTWTVATLISTVINNDNTMHLDNDNHNLRLYKIEVETY